ncbi:MAG: hypothetical protein OXF79_03045, partial [Chloroflexi bacterium]|nr:hypothetical protein [Chloroflexota bacterium]
MTVLCEIRRGVIPARQACKGAPWVIAIRDLERAQLARTGARQGAVTADPRQKTLADRVPAGGVRAWRPLRYPAGRAGAAQAATAGSLTARLSLTGAMDSSV